MNAQWGISVADKGTGIIKDNDLRGNAQGPCKVTLDRRSRLQLNRNRE